MQAYDLKGVSEALTRGALAPESWPAALESAANLTGSAGAVLLPLKGDLPIWSTPSMDEPCNVYVSNGWHSRDERYRSTATVLKTGVATDNDCMSLESRQRSSYYQEFLGRFKLNEWAGVRMGRGQFVWTLSLQRKSLQEPFSRDELRCLREFSNQLDSVTQVSVALNFARSEAALDAFSFSKRPALLFNRSGVVVRANAAAEALIGEDIRISNGRIGSWDKRATEMLHRTLKELFWTSNFSIPKPVVFPKISGGKIVFYAMPMPASLDSPLARFHAIMVIGETPSKRNFAASTLPTVFDLTAAEARLAVSIGNGEELSDYATRLGLSKQTVRNQLKSVFAKTGVTRQADLAATLAGLIPDGD